MARYMCIPGGMGNMLEYQGGYQRGWHAIVDGMGDMLVWVTC